MPEGTSVSTRALSHLCHLSADIIPFVSVRESRCGQARLIGSHCGLVLLSLYILQVKLDHCLQSLIRWLHEALRDVEVVQIHCGLELNTLLQSALVDRFEDLVRGFWIDL